MFKLKRSLGLIDVFAIASGAMISSGLFVLPGLAYVQAGPAVVLSYLLAGIFALAGMFSQAELVSAMPKAGGTYFYVTRSLGPALGTIDGLITWFSVSLKSAFALVGMAAFLELVVPVDIHTAAISLCVIFVLINLIGIKEAGRLQVFLVTFLIAILIFYVAKGFSRINVRNFEPLLPYGYKGLLATAGFVFVSYGGLLKTSSIAEEVKDPAYNVPRGMMFSMFVVVLLYLSVVLVTTGILGDALKHSPHTGAPSLTPISDAAYIIMGRGGQILLSIAAILAFISTANAGIMAASRYPMALSRDALLPQFFSKVNRRFRTPHLAIIFTGVFMVFALFLKLKILVEAASTVLILTYIFSCLSVLIMRESRIFNYQPRFKSPLYPFLQIGGILGYGILLFEMGKEALLVSILLIVIGFVIYLFYGRYASREYALLHFIERITAKELTTRFLESELKEIIRERDVIVKDRFDHIIEKAVVLDIDNEISREEFFKQLSRIIAKRLNLNPDVVLERLHQREEESSTAISPTLAIPHIVVEGRGVFDIFLIRAKKGIRFSEEAPSVSAIFVLVGTADERNFHLRALAAIAQIVQSRDFEKKWIAARSQDELRDVILLGERKRWHGGK